MADIEPESGVELTPPKPPYRVYPWHDMEPGDSFVVEKSRRVAALTSGASYCERWAPHLKATSRKEDEGHVRVWLVEKDDA